MIIIGIIHAIVDIFDMGEIISKMKNGNSSVHFASENSNPNVEFIGVEAILIQFVSMVASLLVAYQGYLTVKTVNQDSAESVSKMMKLTLVFAIIQVLLQLLMVYFLL